MREDLKKRWKLTVSTGLCIYVLGCNAHQVTMNRHQLLDAGDISTQSYQISEAANNANNLTIIGREFDDIDSMAAPILKLRDYICQGMKNVQMLIRHSVALKEVIFEDK